MRAGAGRRGAVSGILLSVVADEVVVLGAASGRSNLERAGEDGDVSTEPGLTFELLAAPGTGLAGPVVGASFVARTVLAVAAAAAAPAPAIGCDDTAGFGTGGGVSVCSIEGKPPAP